MAPSAAVAAAAGSLRSGLCSRESSERGHAPSLRTRLHRRLSLDLVGLTSIELLVVAALHDREGQ